MLNPLESANDVVSRESLYEADLGLKVHNFLKERPKIFGITREEWQALLKDRLSSNHAGILLIVLDMENATVHSVDGTMPQHKDKIVDKLKRLNNTITELTAVEGRRTDTQINEPGSDEYLLLCIDFTKYEALAVLEFIEKVMNEDEPPTPVHIGATYIPEGVLVSGSVALKAANIANGEAKRRNKVSEDRPPQGVKVVAHFDLDESGEVIAEIGGDQYSLEELSTMPKDFPPKIITKDPVKALREIIRKSEETSLRWTVFSPQNMKSINDEFGYDRGDEELIKFSETLLKLFPNSGEIYKIGTYFIITEDVGSKLATDQINQLKASCIYGFQWSSVDVNPLDFKETNTES